MAYVFLVFPARQVSDGWIILLILIGMLIVLKGSEWLVKLIRTKIHDRRMRHMADSE